MAGYYCNYRLLRKRYESYASRIVELLPVNPKRVLEDLDFICEDFKDYSEDIFFTMCDTCIQCERKIYAGKPIPFFWRYLLSIV